MNPCEGSGYCEIKDENFQIVKVDFKKVTDYAVKLVDKEQTEENEEAKKDQVHRALGMILAGLITLYIVGALQSTVDEWFKKLTTLVNGQVH